MLSAPYFGHFWKWFIGRPYCTNWFSWPQKWNVFSTAIFPWQTSEKKLCGTPTERTLLAVYCPWNFSHEWAMYNKVLFRTVQCPWRKWEDELWKRTRINCTDRISRRQKRNVIPVSFYFLFDVFCNRRPFLQFHFLSGTNRNNRTLPQPQKFRTDCDWFLSFFSWMKYYEQARLPWYFLIKSLRVSSEVIYANKNFLVHL